MIQTSILIPAKDEALNIRSCLDSVFSQASNHQFEVILVDSGSTDGSAELIRRARPRRFLQIAPHEYNPARVLNHGMQLAGSDFGIFLNADATPQGPGFIEFPPRNFITRALGTTLPAWRKANI